MTDVHFLHLGNRGDRAHVRNCEAVAGMNGEAGSGAQLGGGAERLQHGNAGPVRVLPGVQLDGVDTQAGRAADGIGVGVDEETGADAGGVETRDGIADSALRGNNVEATLGRDLFTPLGNQRDLVGTNSECDFEHLRRTCHLEIEDRSHRAREPLNVVVLDVPAIFAEVGGDAVGAGLLAHRGGGNGIGVGAPPRLSDRCDVIDVDVQPDANRHALLLLRLEAPIRFARVLMLETSVKKLLLILVLGIACRQSEPKELTGAASPRAAVDQFMLAIRAEDIQALSAVWGNAKGPAREQYPIEEIRMRQQLMLCYFGHDRYAITGESTVSDKKRVILADITKGTMKRTAEFVAERGRSNRWYASVIDVTPLKDFCQPKRTG